MPQTATDTVPHDIVCEFLGSIQFTPDNGEDDCAIAEQIAGQTYPNLDQLAAICHGQCSTAKLRRECDAAVLEMRDNPFFMPYFKADA